ncbi:MAG TPA: tetratricopeptide repeat protein [Terriglobia bacterium]|nr:tetratricopeptide repeat protein [Terriglobia bacterium]
MERQRHSKKGWVFSSVLLCCLALSQAWGWAQQSAPSNRNADAAYESGMQLVRAQQYSRALAQFKRVEKEAPRLPQGYTGEGITLALMGRPQDAIVRLKKALEIDSSFWVARRELGIIEWQMGSKDEAANELRSIEKLFPNDPPVAAILGEYDFDRGRYPEASNEFSRAADQVATSTPLSLMWAESLLKTGNQKAAAAKLELLCLVPNLTPDQRLKLGWLLGEAGDYPKAVEVFNSLPESSPHPFQRGYGLALAYYNLGRYADCARKLAELQSRKIVGPELFSLLGAAEEGMGNTLRAYDAFRQGIYEFPHDDENYLNIATLSVQHFNYSVATQVLTSGIQEIPNDNRLFLTRGVIYTLQEKLQQAQDDYERALKLAPEKEGVYVALGICLMDEDEYVQAQRVLEKGIARGLRDVLLNYFLADALFRQGITANSPRYAQAFKVVQTALKIDPDFAYAYMQRGRLELVDKKIDAAVADLERARSLEPGSRVILYQLAVTYERAGKKAEADKLFASVSQASQEEEAHFRKGRLVEIMTTVSQPRVVEP